MPLRSFFLNDVISSRIFSPGLRARLYRRLGLRVGKGVTLSGAGTVSGRDVEVGDGTFIGYGFFLDGDGPVRIGRDCDLAQRVSVHTVTHAIGPAKRRAGQHEKRPTSIGDGCWIGAGVTILPGVTVGDGCVVAAGSVVTRDCDPNGMYAGVPARRVRDLPQMA